MLSEGWDTNTVTHVVGLRPFGSQLLCEQVVGRALRRKSYDLDEETGMFAEETAKVFGVPFELIPFKVDLPKPPPPRSPRKHIYAVPEKAEHEITFPIVEGYHQSDSLNVFVDWSRVPRLTLDPAEIPGRVELAALTTPHGALAVYGPGEKPILTLEEWRNMFRDQEVAFRLACEVCKSWHQENGDKAVPMQRLFPEVAFAAMRFLATKLIRKGDSKPCDVLHVGEYMQSAVSSLLEAISRGSFPERTWVAIIPRGEAGRGSTRHVDYYTRKNIWPANKSHLNVMEADTKVWEQSAGSVLDGHPGVKSWVKNSWAENNANRLGFVIPYRHRGRSLRYVPDFIVVTDRNQNVILEIKGRDSDGVDIKTKAALRWIDAVNRLGTHGFWEYLLVFDPSELGVELNDFTDAKWE